MIKTPAKERESLRLELLARDFFNSGLVTDIAVCTRTGTEPTPQQIMDLIAEVRKGRDRFTDILPVFQGFDEVDDTPAYKSQPITPGPNMPELGRSILKEAGRDDLLTKSKDAD